MSTSPPVQIHADSLDIHGITAATSTRSLTDPRLGTIYNPSILAAATPIHFHPTPTSDNFVGVFSNRYTGGTLSPTNPAAYTAWTHDAAPSWALINAVTGTTTPIHGSFSIPMTSQHDSAVVQGACSIPPGYLYLLNTVTNGAVTTAVVQHFLWSNQNVMRNLAEETIPTITVDDQTVLFDRGIYFDSPFVVAVGHGLTDHRIYLARERFGGIGNPGYSWQFQSANGWSDDAEEAAPLPISTYGPCSAAIYKGRVFLSTVQTGESVNTAVIYSPTKTNKWLQYGTPVALGSAGSSYLGGLYLQPQLGANPTSAMLTNQGNVAAFPMVQSQLSTGGGASTINTVWDLLGITRLV